MQRKLLMTMMLCTVITVADGLSAPVNEALTEAQRGIEQVGSSAVEISIDGARVAVKGATGQTLEVVSITGLVIKKIKIDSASYSFELDVPKGCYILKVGTTVRKVNIS